jgi:hypothetical protein
VEPTLAQLLDEKGSYVRERRALWPYWLVLALLINFLEVAIRKGHFRRLSGWVRRRLETRGSTGTNVTGAPTITGAPSIADSRPGFRPARV